MVIEPGEAVAIVTVDYTVGSAGMRVGESLGGLVLPHDNLAVGGVVKRR